MSSPSPVVAAAPAWRRPALLGAADQIVSSGTNYATSLVALVTLGAVDFGNFVTAFSVVTVAAAVQRGFVGEPAMTLVPGREPAEQRALLSSALWCALAFGLLAGVLAAACRFTGWPFAEYLLWLAVWLPGLLVQDAARYALFSLGRPQDALAIDLVWAGTQGVLLLGVLLTSGPGASSVVWTWGCGALAAAAVFVLAARRGMHAPSLRWLAESRHLSGWLTGSNALGQAQLPVILIVLGLVGGAVEVAGFRAVQLLVLPAVQMLTAAMVAVFTPRFAGFAARGDAAAVLATVARLVRVFAVLGVVLVVLGPVGAAVLGAVVPQYAGSTGLILPISIQAALFLVNVALDAAVRGMGRVRFQLFLQLGVTVAMFGGVVLGGSLWGVGGVAWVLTGCALAYLVGTASNYRAGLRRLSGAGPAHRR